MTRYRTIVADPPWPLEPGGTARSSSWAKPRPGGLPYPPLPIAEIARLPVRELAADGAHLYLWTVNAYVEHAYSVARAWGFRPVVLLTWCKAPRGLGLGGAFTQTTEHVLFARRGSCPTASRVDSTWFQWKRGEHSVKPDAFIDMVEEVSPAPRLELFARRQRLGWDTWGNEALQHVELTA